MCMEKEVKGNKRKIKGKWKGKETKEIWKGNGKGKKLSDPSPFNNILNNIQFLLAVIGIKHSYF